MSSIPTWAKLIYFNWLNKTNGDIESHHWTRRTEYPNTSFTGFGGSRFESCWCKQNKSRVNIKCKNNLFSSKSVVALDSTRNVLNLNEKSKWRLWLFLVPFCIRKTLWKLRVAFMKYLLLKKTDSYKLIDIISIEHTMTKPDFKLFTNQWERSVQRNAF